MMGCGARLRVVLVLTAVMNSAAWSQDGKPASPPSPASPATEPAAPAPGAGNDRSDDKANERDSRGWLPPGEDPENRLITPFLKHMVKDQEFFWTSPGHLQKSDWQWLVPSAVIAGSLVASDSWISKQVPDSTQQLKRSKDLSDYATFSLIGLSAGSFLLGHWTSNDHLEESGLLSGEAALNSTAVAYFLKEITQRPRPYQGNGHGSFFQGGGSFPSEHAAVAWSVASVWAHEYPGKLSQILAYGLASAVSVTRVTSKQHFASDVAIGSALGWYFGREVYRAHHDRELGGTSWDSPLPESVGEKTRNPEYMGSPYVPLDSWVYPAIERLSALGYIQTAYLGIRPWTRMECARLLGEANDQASGDSDENGQAAKLLTDLGVEFQSETARLNGAENLGVSLDSVYTRVTSISGPPLVDGYHFGQTIINDFGRPYGEGFNNVSGFTAHAVAGPLAFYIRGEYQHAPAVPSVSVPVQQDIANADLTTPVPNGKGERNQFDLLEASVAVNAGNVRISFGKQSQWLGVGESGSLLMSDNAEPILMLKFDTVVPFRLPLVSKVLGPIQLEYFLGRLSGQQFELNGGQLLGPGNISPQPFLDGGKVSFRPTSNFEFGMGFTAQFAGPGLPFTWQEFLRTFYVHNQTGPTTAGNNPAKRISEADFSYRVPGLRNWLTFYGDALAVDEISPIGSSRATVHPGIYLPQLPKIPKLELRAEGINEPLTTEFAPGFVYYGLRRYRSGYTNNGNLLGNWIGRAGRGGQGWLTYRLSSQSDFGLGYRLQEVSTAFIGGGRLEDYSARGNFALRSDLSFSASLQYEQWSFPVLATTRQSNVTASFQLTFYPKELAAHR
jgi:Capsule assembly protein Wzi/PAP2 superfamily